MSFKRLLGISLFLLYSSVVCASGVALPRSVPEAQGVSSSGILEWVDRLDAHIDSVHSVMVVRNGHVVAEGWWSPFEPERQHMLYSLSKSVTSIAVGLAIEEGLISLDDTVISHFPNDAPETPSDNLKRMRIRDLLTMNSGHRQEVLRLFDFGSNGNLARDFLRMEVAHKPGTLFAYNTPATYMCSAIVQRASGEKLVDYLGQRLFEPLGIESPVWSESAEGTSHGGFGLNLKTEDVAKFGQLMLQRGEWNGEPLVPAAWIDEATAKQTSNGSDPNSDWEQGYGYQFWRCRPGFYRGDGAHGQFCIVVPEKNAVIAITSGTLDMGGVMRITWERLLPALADGKMEADGKSQKELMKRLSTLSLDIPRGKAKSAMAANVSGKTFVFDDNAEGMESVSLALDDSGSGWMRIAHNGKTHTIELAHGRWARGESDFVIGLELRVAHEQRQSIAATGAWSGASVYEARLAFDETPLVMDIALKFDGDSVSLDAKYNPYRSRQGKLPTYFGKSK